MRNFSLKQFITSNNEVRIYINSADSMRKIWLFDQEDKIQVDTDAADVCFFSKQQVGSETHLFRAITAIARQALKENNLLHIRKFSELRKAVNLRTARIIVEDFKHSTKVDFADYKNTRDAANAFEKYIKEKMKLQNFPKIDESIEKSELKKIYVLIISDILNS